MASADILWQVKQQDLATIIPLCSCLRSSLHQNNLSKSTTPRVILPTDLDKLLWLILSSLAKNKPSSVTHLYNNMLLLRCTSVVHIGLSNVRRQPVKLEFTIE
ncbi:hypothetical protein T12_637 [Trichinella patagoniensis]|uniref:Uncharacterized protein n=1 Tax=Trichinella patagoniensis TaxID=990121 RepID=A0A0V0Z6C5_9BILA|nr:hypothetical protein T12_637 [Trichinella patagoniensis]